MGCGCRRTTRKTTNNSRLSVRRPVISTSVHNKRKKICMSCNYSTKINSKNYIRKCTKSNKSLGSIIRTFSFKCPIGNF